MKKTLTLISHNRTLENCNVTTWDQANIGPSLGLRRCVTLWSLDSSAHLTSLTQPHMPQAANLS